MMRSGEKTEKRRLLLAEEIDQQDWEAFLVSMKLWENKTKANEYK